MKTYLNKKRCSQRISKLLLSLWIVILPAYPDETPFLIRNNNRTSRIILNLFWDGRLEHGGVQLDPLQTKELMVPQTIQKGSHKITVSEVYSASMTKLAGFELLFQPHIKNKVNGTSILADLLNQIKLSIDFDIEVADRTGERWGVLVRADTTKGSVFDNLVAVYNENNSLKAIFGSDVTVSTSGSLSIKPDSDYLLDSNSKIYVYGEDGNGLSTYYASLPGQEVTCFDLWNTNAEIPEDGPNKGNIVYTAQRAPGDTIFEFGKWTIYSKRVNTKTKPFTVPMAKVESAFDNVYALYQAKGTPDDKSRANIVSIINSIARTSEIPPHILYGIAFEETPVRARMQHFTKTGLTRITGDGGIGIMQHTQGTALADYSRKDASGYRVRTPQHGIEALKRIAKLASDISFNVQAAADLMNYNWQNGLTVGDSNPEILEDWYQAVRAYNSGSSDYAQRVFGHISHAFAPVGVTYYWTKVPISLPDSVDQRTKTILYTPAPAHLDSGYTGSPKEIPVSFNLQVKRTSTSLRSLDYRFENIPNNLIPLGNVILTKASVQRQSGGELLASFPAQIPALMQQGDSRTVSVTISSDESVTFAKAEIDFLVGHESVYRRPKKVVIQPAAFVTELPGEALGNLRFTSLSSDISLVPGGQVTNFGSIKNFGDQNVFINGFELQSSHPNIKLEPLSVLLDSPEVMSPNASLQGNVFSAAIDSAQPPGEFSAIISIIGGSTESSQEVLARESTLIHVEETTSSPVSVSLTPAESGELTLRVLRGTPPFQLKVKHSLSDSVWDDFGDASELPIFTIINEVTNSLFFRVVSEAIVDSSAIPE